MSTLHDNVLAKYQTNVFCETGSWRGEAIGKALKLGVEKVISIELAENWYQYCEGKFKGHPKVQLVFGDSAKILYDCIKDIDEKILFWIDAHKSDSHTAQSDLGAPISHELKQIGQHHIKIHTIMIDDMRCWNKDIGFHFGDEEIIGWLKDINPDYKFAHEDGAFPSDILVAYV